MFVKCFFVKIFVCQKKDAPRGDKKKFFGGACFFICFDFSGIL